MRLDFFEIYMAHDRQQNAGRVQKGRLHANLDSSILVQHMMYYSALMLSLMADCTKLCFKLCYRSILRGNQ